MLAPLAPASTLLDRFPTALATVLDDQGAPADFIDDEVSPLGSSCCVPTANRSLIGVTNEYVRLAGYAQDDSDGPLDLRVLSRWLAQVPMSPLDKRHGSADRELAALIAARS